VTAVPRLGIGLPVGNGENYLSESLDALLGQSCTDFELIISDNASTDGTEDTCRQYLAQDRRIRYVRQPRNIGCTANHNLVVRHARGELFKWASHDDLYGRDLLRRCVEALDEHPDVVLASCWSALIDGAGNISEVVAWYPPATDSTRAPERFRGLLFALAGDDDYGVIRTDVLRRIPPPPAAIITRTGPSSPNWPCTDGSTGSPRRCTSAETDRTVPGGRSRPSVAGA